MLKEYGYKGSETSLRRYIKDVVDQLKEQQGCDYNQLANKLIDGIDVYKRQTAFLEYFDKK